MYRKLKGLLERQEGEIVGIASTEMPDRDGEIIKQDGWDLTNFKSNPVIMVSHNYQDFPIGKATDIFIDKQIGRLQFKAVFSQATQKAKEAYALVKEGILNTFSVGFIPREYDQKDNSIITKAELLEISLVAVPANPGAIVLAKGMKDNVLAKDFVEEWNVKFPEKEVEEVICPHCKNNINSDITTTEVIKTDDRTNGEDSGEGRDKDLIKIMQSAVGSMQKSLCEMKKKGGANK